MKNLKEMLVKKMWVYEFDGGDKGIVLAESREDATRKLKVHYPDIAERVESEEAYIYNCSNVEIVDDIFVIVPW